MTTATARARPVLDQEAEERFENDPAADQRRSKTKQFIRVDRRLIRLFQQPAKPGSHRRTIRTGQKAEVPGAWMA